MSLKSAAKTYARREWGVFPLKVRNKRPATEHGVKDATTERVLINSYWGTNPDYNVALATGVDSGFFVVDIDPRNGGDDSWDALTMDHDVPETLSATTGSGGKHYLFRYPDRPVLLKGKMATGIDIKGTGGYIVAPPSVHPDGGVYTWDNEDADIAEAPDWLLALVEREAPKRVERGPVDPNDDRPGSRFNAETDWAEILEPHGWRAVRAEGSVTHWQRPGKTDGPSATSNYEGSDLLYVFTSSTDFEPDTAYSKFAAFAVLECDGDYSEAAKEIVIRQGLAAAKAGATLFKRFDEKPKKKKGKGADKEYRFTPAFHEDHFVSRYVEYVAEQTDAALEYGEACGLSLLSLAAVQTRVKLGPYGEHGLPMNLYLMLVGDSTRSRKSTSQRIMRTISEWALPGADLPSRVTTEALIELLAKQSPGAALWTPDEFGVLLAQIGRRDFLRGIEELMLTVYGGDTYTYVKAGDKEVRVNDPHLTVVAASTPEALGMAGPTAQVTGLLPRFGVVFPRTLPPPRTVDGEVHVASVRNGLTRQLREIRDWSRETDFVTFSSESLALLSEAEAALQQRGEHVVRLPAMLHKVAALSAVGDMRERVSEEDASAAIRVVLRWAEGAEHLRPFMRLQASDISFERSLEQAREVFLRLCKETGIKTVPRFKIAREAKMTKQRLDAIEATLADRNYITVDRSGGTWTKP
jgi:hypothetical protein